MMKTFRGIYRGGVVQLLESPEVSEDTEVVVTFLRETASTRLPSDTDETGAAKEGQLLEDFEPIVPAKPIHLSDLVLEGRN